jgi:predicted AAA+ superfamily ATPase
MKVFKRKLYKKLLDWKASSRRKPLIIRGARQVGKSTLVRLFSKEYKYYIELNLERAQDKKNFDFDSAQLIMEAVLLRENMDFDTKPLLLFIDEIQESPRAIQMLRFFYEDFPDVHVICAGSLLEHVLKDINSFPVGRVQQMVLHPFDFEEYLAAKGEDRVLKQLDEVPIKEFAHHVLLEKFHEYTIIGGMPEVVKTYIENKTLTVIKEVYDEIWQSYKDDIEKYGRNLTERKVIRHIIETAPYEKDRITMAGFGNSNYKSREVGEALRALDKSRLVLLMYPAINTKFPQEIDFKRKPRLQFLDTGLLNYALGIQAELLGLTDFSDFHRGRIIQHMVYQQVLSQHNEVGFQAHFWVREKSNSNSEVDLVLPFEKSLIPIEIKSGPHGRLRSLFQFMEQVDHNFAIRLLANHWSLEDVTTTQGKKFKLLNLPYYLSTRLENYAGWLVKPHQLLN